MKVLITLLFILSLSGCAVANKYMVSPFDNVEYGKLVELNTTASTPNGPEKSWCNSLELQMIHYYAKYLATYSKHTLNSNIANTYQEIYSLSEELYTRKNPSNAYCKIKRNNIFKVTTSALEVYGDRRK